MVGTKWWDRQRSRLVMVTAENGDFLQVRTSGSRRAGMWMRKSNLLRRFSKVEE